MKQTVYMVSTLESDEVRVDCECGETSSFDIERLEAIIMCEHVTEESFVEESN